MVVLRRLVLSLLALVLVLGLAGLAAWRLAAPTLLSGAIERQARGLGIEIARVEVEALAPSRLVLTDLATDGGGVTIERVTVRFDPERLWRERHVESVTIAGARLDLAIGPDGAVRIPGVALPAGGGGDEAGLPPLPFDRIELESLTIAAATPAGPVTAMLGGNLRRPAEGGAVADLSGTVEHAAGTAEAIVDGHLRPDDSFAASLGLSAATLSHAGWRIEGAEGWVAASGRPGAIDSVDAAVSAATADGPDVSLVAPSALIAGTGGAWPDTAIARVRLADGDRVIGRGAVDLALTGAEDGGVPTRFGLDLSIDLEEARPPVDQWASDLPVRADSASVVLALDGPAAPWLEALRRDGWPSPVDGTAAGQGEPHSTGRLDVAFEGLVPAPARADGAAPAPDADSVAGAAGGGAVPGRISIAGDLAVDGEAVRLTGTTPWVLDLPPIAGTGLPALTLQGDADGAQRLAWHRSTAVAPRRLTYAGGFRLALERSALASPDGAPLTGRVDAALALPDQGAPRLTVSPLSIGGGALALAQGVLTIERLRVDGGGGADAATATVEGTVGFDGGLPGGVAAEQARLTLGGTVDWNGGRAVLHLDDCASLSAVRLSVGDAVALAEPSGLCVAAPEDGPAIIYRPQEAGAAAALDLALRLRPSEVSGRIAGLGAVEATLPEITVTGTLAPGPSPRPALGGGDADRLAVAWQGGRLSAPAHDLVLDRLSGEAAIRTSGALGDGEARVEASYTVEQVTIDRPRSPVVPLRLTGTATVLAEGSLTAEATAGSGGLQARLDLAHDAETGAGRLGVTADPISFAPGVRQPAELFPMLEGLPVDAVTGTVRGIVGTVEWGEGVSTGGRMTLDGVTVEGPFGTVSGIDGSLRAGSLSPLTLPVGQRLTADSARIGLDLGPGEIVFGLQPGLRLAVSGLGFAWAGGQLSAEPFTMALDSPNLTVVLTARGVDLSEVAGQLPLSSLSATGTLAGRVPVRLTPDTIEIEDARLETTGPGIIRYRPNGDGSGDASGPGQPGGVDLLMTALEDFHYDSLVLSIDGETGGDLTARIEIDGANPDLYDGWPIDLNVDVSGELAEVLRSGLRSMSIGGRSRDIIERELNR